MKSEKKTLTKLEVIEIANGIGHISGLNKETGFPVYDLGPLVHAALGRTQRHLKGVMETLAEEQKPHDERQRDIATERDEALKKLNGEANRSEVEKPFQERFEEARKLRAAWHKEPTEVSLFPFKWSDIRNKGLTPTPEILAYLEPLIIYDDK